MSLLSKPFLERCFKPVKCVNRAVIVATVYQGKCQRIGLQSGLVLVENHVVKLVCYRLNIRQCVGDVACFVCFVLLCQFFWRIIATDKLANPCNCWREHCWLQKKKPRTRRGKYLEEKYTAGDCCGCDPHRAPG